MGKTVISVVSGKGGVGKSTLAVNLAVLLSKANIPTVLIDADIYNPCVFFHLGLSPQSAGLQELLNSKSTLGEVLSIHPGSGLRCISSSVQPYGRINAKRLQNVIDSLDYEFVIIDCPPGFSPLIEEAVAVSSVMLVMMTPDVPSSMAALKLVSFIKSHARGGEGKQFMYFLNRVASTQYEIHPHEVEEIFKTKLTATLVEDQNVPKSIAAKTPLVMLSPACHTSRELFSFAKTLLRDAGLASHPLAAAQRHASHEAKQPHGKGAGILSSISLFIRRLFWR
jgi:MinD-like ATPase involved in chromosome partitioning or flagellar assembly